MPPSALQRSTFPRWISRLWILVPVAATVYLIWTNTARIRHIEFVSGTAMESLGADSTSPTGFAEGLRMMIPPERAIESSRWIIETQQMAHEGKWRLRHLDLDNAPEGRVVRTPSAYRWWLGGLAWLDQRLSGRPFGQSVERAALYVDPLIHLLLLTTVSVFVARQFGPFPAAVAAVALVGFFPLAGSFQPGLPTDLGLALACLLWSVLPIASGIHILHAPAPKDDDAAPAERAAPRNRRARRHFLTAGIFGGLGLWIDLPGQLSMLAGLGTGGMLMAWLRHRHAEGSPFDEALRAPWRAWAVGGAIISCTAFLLERAPRELSWALTDGIHWIHAVGWLAAGEILKCADNWGRVGQLPRKPLAIGLAAAAGATLTASLFLMVFQAGINPFAGGLFSWRLTPLPGSPIAESVRAWLQRDGLSSTARATILPLVILAPAAWIAIRDRPLSDRRLDMVLLLGPVVVLTILACVQLRAWNQLDAVLLVILIAAITPGRESDDNSIGKRMGAWSMLAALLVLPGLLLLQPPNGYANSKEINQTEAEYLVERNLAHWLVRRAGSADTLVLAPPQLTASLAYYGSIKGLGTFYPENDDGMAAAIRIASSTSDVESLALLENRGVTHVIVPSWDSGLTDYARVGSGVPSGTFVAVLGRWDLPPSIHPIVYPMPRIPGWERESVTVFEVVEEQDPADALSRLAEYFIEMGEIDRAAGYRIELGDFPASLGALAARAQIEMARGDAASFSTIMDWIVPYTEGGAARSMPWDRRVSLAIVLTQGRERSMAREQVEACLKRIDDSNLRSLTPSSLYRFQLLCKMYDLEIQDPDIRDRARAMVPPDLRERL